MMPFQSCILARDSGRSKEMSEEQRKREVKSRLLELKRQEELRQQRKREEFLRGIAKRSPEMAQKRKQQWLQSDQRRKEFKNEREEAGGIACWFAKAALGETEEQWKLIQPKLEKVINLWDQANSTIEAGGSSNSQTAIVPKLQWHRPWKYKPLLEMTEAQRLARELRILLEKKDTPPEVFRSKVAALRKARSEQAEIGKQLVEARRQLREILTTRQEAILVLLGWL
jgi:hypothetical protein